MMVIQNHLNISWNPYVVGSTIIGDAHPDSLVRLAMQGRAIRIDDNIKAVLPKYFSYFHINYIRMYVGVFSM